MTSLDKEYTGTAVPSSFTVSVTGHRNTEQTEALQNCIKALFNQIAATCVALDTKVSLRLNTALAAGADQSAAKALLSANKESQDWQWALHVILPFERESYQQSLNVGLKETTPTIAKSFDGLIKEANTVFELADLEVVPPVKDPDLDAARQQYWQSQRYRTLGSMLARQADVLLAIWNGKPAGGPGGTGDVVSMALAQGKSVIRINPETLELSFLQPSPLNTDPIRLARTPTIPQTPDILNLFDAEESYSMIKLVREAILEPAGHDKHKPIKPLSSAEAFLGTGTIEQLQAGIQTTFLDRVANFTLRPIRNTCPEKTRATTRWSPYQHLINITVALFETDKKDESPISLSEALKRMPRQVYRFIVDSSTAIINKARKMLTLTYWTTGLRVNYAEDDWMLPPYQPDDSEKKQSAGPHKYYTCNTPRPPQLNEADALLFTPMVATDAIATARAHAYRSSYVINFLGGALAVWFGLAGLIWEPKVVFVGIELVLLLALVVLYFVADRHSWHERWLNARFITETLRAGRFIVWLGMGGRRALSKTTHWAAWYSSAVVAFPPGPNGTLTSDQLRYIARELRSHVTNQKDYHESNESKLRRVHRGLELLGSFCLIAAIVVAAFFVLISIFLGIDHDIVKANKPVVTAVCAGLPILAAALMGIRFQGDFERFAERSEETKHQLHEIDDRLDAMIEREVEPSHQPLFEELTQIVIDLNETYERDLQDWYYVYSARPSMEP